MRLSALRGRPVVLYFYPRSDTPGCTAQASGIRDAFADFTDRGAVVLGVSSDTVARQAAFRKKYDLPFSILADPGHEAGRAYGVEQDGKKTFERSTFVIDPDGNVARIMRRVDPRGHAERVLEALPARE